jgi:2-polyprenyl-3-methyl-5-hydroxy-6-metoxy-1,4-benzoquinol methylase
MSEPRTTGRDSSEAGAPAAQDIAGQGYWDDVWQRRDRQRLVDPRAPGVRNFLRREFHAFFVDALGRGDGRSLLEVGCADSIWLPYFHTELGFAVEGLDYSPEGCEKAEQTLHEARVAARVHCADLFEPSKNLLGRFDIVFTYGLVEHFSDTRAALAALAAFARPGGRLLTLVPNMTSAMGWMQRRFNAAVYDKHVPLSLGALAAAHERAELRVERAERLLSLNFGVLIPSAATDGPLAGKLKRGVHAGLLAGMVPIWALESRGIRLLPKTDALTPYFAVLARKK